VTLGSVSHGTHDHILLSGGSAILQSIDNIITFTYVPRVVTIGDNKKIYNGKRGSAYKVLKLKEKRELKINASNQSNNQIQKQKARKVNKVYVYYNIHPSVRRLVWVILG
jgi:hypothetical protein